MIHKNLDLYLWSVLEKRRLASERHWKQTRRTRKHLEVVRLFNDLTQKY